MLSTPHPLNEQLLIFNPLITPLNYKMAASVRKPKVDSVFDKPVPTKAKPEVIRHVHFYYCLYAGLGLDLFSFLDQFEHVCVLVF